jgi:hypothetical protein
LFNFSTHLGNLRPTNRRHFRMLGPARTLPEMNRPA